MLQASLPLSGHAGRGVHDQKSSNWCFTITESMSAKKKGRYTTVSFRRLSPASHKHGSFVMLWSIKEVSSKMHDHGKHVNITELYCKCTGQRFLHLCLPPPSHRHQGNGKNKGWSTDIRLVTRWETSWHSEHTGMYCWLIDHPATKEFTQLSAYAAFHKYSLPWTFPHFNLLQP